jgi:hypothetical protein
MVPYPRLARCNYIQMPKIPLVCILRRNQRGGGVVKLPTLNSYDMIFPRDRDKEVTMYLSIYSNTPPQYMILLDVVS